MTTTDICDTEVSHHAHLDGLAWSQDTEPAAKLNATPKEAPPSVQPWSSVLLRATAMLTVGVCAVIGASMLPHSIGESAAPTPSQVTQTTDIAIPELPAPPPDIVSMDDPDRVYQLVHDQHVTKWRITDLDASIKSAHDLCDYMAAHSDDPISDAAALVRRLYPKTDAHDSRGLVIAAARAYCRQYDQETLP